MFSFVQVAKQLILDKLWPFFIRNIWPQIQEQIIWIIIQIFVSMQERIEAYLNRRNEVHDEVIQKKARDAEQKADSTDDLIEAAHWRGKAEAYKDIAENLKIENDKLREKLNQIIKETVDQVQSEINGIDIEVNSLNQIEIGGKSISITGIDVDENIIRRLNDKK